MLESHGPSYLTAVRGICWSTVLLTCTLLTPASATGTGADKVISSATSVLEQEFNDLGDSLEIIFQPTRHDMNSCASPTAFLSNRQISRSGRLFVSIECHGTPPRTFYLQATLKVTGKYLVAAKAISAGTLLREDMLREKQGDLTPLLTVAATRLEDAVGQVAKRNLDPGAVIKKQELQEQLLVEQGQAVSLDIVGDGFKISSKGEALQGGNLGDLVEVRTAGRKKLAGMISGQGTIRVMM